MSSKQWYQKLFENYGRSYDSEPYINGTTGECDFIEREISCNKSVKILDIGCGTGRHSIELAKRGYHVTGIDLSESMLAAAKEKAAKLGLTIDFMLRDARQLCYTAEFGLAIMLCGGGFPLMETDEMNYQILRNATHAVKTGGKFIFTTLNGLFPLFHSVKEYIASGGNAVSGGMDSSFDLLTFRYYTTFESIDDNGNKRIIKANERYYAPCEITWLLQSLGWSKIELFGAKLGAFSRNDKLTTEDFEMLVVAEK
ncbi:MAG: class I SAM-dependent methyltransferase [Phycisphaerae bacterium]|nr:class I SAM-dependent methyltransferase [Phycisphaerae bacterium]